jgi:hypothetical protein
VDEGYPNPPQNLGKSAYFELFCQYFWSPVKPLTLYPPIPRFLTRIMYELYIVFIHLSFSIEDA